MKRRKNLGALFLAMALLIMDIGHMGTVYANEAESLSGKVFDSTSMDDAQLDEREIQMEENENQPDVNQIQLKENEIGLDENQPQSEENDENENEISPEAGISMGDNLTVEGTDSFGMLLADMVETEIVEQDENNGCNIFSIEISGSTAVVTFETSQYATLVVGVYDESGTEMLASGRIEVTSDETAKYVEIEIDTMPDYFYLKGFLIDPDCLRPLCTAYTSPNYTREMQEFLAKTTDDFDQSRVLNLDEDKTNNFAVYREDVIIISQSEGINTVLSADDVSNTYIIENIDSQISCLQPGGIFSYEYTDGSVLIVMVSSISIDGTTAYITGIETSMDEVFDYVKIDTTSYTSDIEVDEASCEEGVLYEGKVEMADENEIQPYIDLEGSASMAAKFSLAFSDKSQMISIPLAYIAISPFWGVYIRFIPSVVVEASGKIEVSGVLDGTIGVSASIQEGIKSLTTTPKLRSEVKGELTIFIGLSMEPEVAIIHENVADAKMTAKTGAEVKGTLTYSTDTSVEPSASKVHECAVCVDGDINAKASAEFESIAPRLQFWMRMVQHYKL